MSHIAPLTSTSADSAAGTIPPALEGDIRLLSLNAHAWLEEHQIPKLYRIARAIIDWGVDAVALQEVNQSVETPVLGEEDAQNLGFVGGCERPIRVDNYGALLVQILRQLGAENYQLAWGDAHLGFGVYDEGVAIVSRLPVEEVRRLPHAEGFDYDNVRRRLSLGMKVSAKPTAASEGDSSPHAGSVWVVTGHYSWWEDPAFSDEPQGFPLGEPKPGADKYLLRAEWDYIQPQFVDLASTAPVVLAGDYNNAAHVTGQGYELVLASRESGPWADSFVAAEEVIGEGTVHK